MTADTLPLYLKIRDQLRARIARGEWSAGEALPSETALAGVHGVSQGTVRKALSELVRSGLVERRQGVGTFVAFAPGETGARRWTYFVTGPDESAETEARSAVIRRAPLTEAETALFGLGTPTEAWTVERLRILSNAVPVMDRIRIPVHIAPDLGAHPLDTDLYVTLQMLSGLTLGGVSDQVRAIPAPRQVAWGLMVAPGDPILCITRQSRDLSGTVVELRHTYLETDATAYLCERGRWGNASTDRGDRAA